MSLLVSARFIGWVKLHRHETWLGKGLCIFFPSLSRFWTATYKTVLIFIFDGVTLKTSNKSRSKCGGNVEIDDGLWISFHIFLHILTYAISVMSVTTKTAVCFMWEPPSTTPWVTCGWGRSYLLHNCTFLQSHVGQVVCPKPSSHQKLLPLSKTHRYAVKGVEFVLYNYWQLILLFFDHFWRFQGALYATRIQSGTTKTSEQEKR